MSSAGRSRVVDVSGRFLGELLLRRSFPLYVVEVVDELGRRRGESNSEGHVFDAAGAAACFVSRRFRMSRPDGGEVVGQVDPDGTIRSADGSIWGRISPMIDDRAVGGVAMLML